MVDVAQLVRVVDCGSIGRGFEPHLPPKNKKSGWFNIFRIFCSHIFYFAVSVFNALKSK